MVFSSIEFLFYFLPISLLAYFLLRLSKKLHPLSTISLLISSLVFYTWGGGSLVFLLLFVICANYIIGLLINKIQKNGKKGALPLTIGIIINISALGYFKYFNFAVDNFNSILGWMGVPASFESNVILPIGISFYIFQAISYLIDLYRGEVRVFRDPLKVALYISMFPQLIAGPIVRARTVEKEIRSRRVSADDFGYGAALFSHGLFKKVVIADSVAPLADATFAMSPQDLTLPTAWIGILAYTVQIYFDFSGYSDMAIGLGRMFGFHFPVNFFRPYSAVSVTDFWRRWHISLSSWFRDYLYIPLGGSRGSTFSTYRNLIIVFLITGIWHGAAWTFLFWGPTMGPFS
ncbi:MBOAT family O-acyltransferase [Henriciella marina]|uniref:MBOAT family O-acyltransferase n=1 Tax=Henriciella marina TaxID=453851 RepID=UPI000382E1E5|nr:MBOAT family O-acyltransferase [Henriciella marina]